ncbi:hypothetical protein Droror1_Dr00021289 [Drosera rotundifolia]
MLTRTILSLSAPRCSLVQSDACFLLLLLAAIMELHRQGKLVPMLVDARAITYTSDQVADPRSSFFCARKIYSFLRLAKTGRDKYNPEEVAIHEGLEHTKISGFVWRVPYTRISSEASV